MRVFFSCSDKGYEALENVLKANGLKSLFFKNIIKKLKDENGNIPEERIFAVLMDKFTITFDNKKSKN